MKKVAWADMTDDEPSKPSPSVIVSKHGIKVLKGVSVKKNDRNMFGLLRTDQQDD